MYEPDMACCTPGCNNPKAELAKPIITKKRVYTIGAFCKDCQAIEDKKTALTSLK